MKLNFLLLLFISICIFKSFAIEKPNFNLENLKFYVIPDSCYQELINTH